MKFGDIILFKPSGIIGKLICLVDGSPYSHGAIYLGKQGGEELFIESHEARRGVVIVRLEDWRKNYVVLRPKHIKSPKTKRQVYNLLNTPYDYARLWWIFKSKLFGFNAQNDSPAELICTELCDNVWHYDLGAGKTCTPATIYKLWKDGHLEEIKV